MASGVSQRINPVQGVNVIVAAGSVDGMLATAACVRHAANPNIHLVFTQAFEVHKVDMSKWPEKSNVGLVDLGVNNEGSSPNPQLTVDFVKKICANGHKIYFIADEHGKKAWNDVLEQCGLSRDELSIKPKDRGEKYGSSSEIIAKKLQKTILFPIDSHTRQLLRDGNEADRMNFKTPFGEICNASVKSKITDPERRPYVAKHLAFHDSPDEKIQAWMDEYAQIESNQPKILETCQYLGDGLALYDCSIGLHDPTAIFNAAYKKHSVVVLIGTGGNGTAVSIATSRKDLNLLSVVQGAGIKAGGMAARINLAAEDLDSAIEAIQEAL